MSKIYILLLSTVLFILPIFKAYSQNSLDNYISKNIVRLSKKANINSIQLEKIASLSTNFNYSQKSEEKKDYKSFRKQITTILPIETFSTVFDSILTVKAKNQAIKITQQKISKLSLKLNKEQEKGFYDIAYKHLRKIINSQYYYAYQPSLLEKHKENFKQQRIQESTAYLKQLTRNSKKTEITSINSSNLNTKIKAFKEKAQKLGINTIKIDSIETLYANFNTKLANIETHIQKNGSLVSFNNPQLSRKKLVANLKREIKLILAFNEFKQLFKEQFAFDINEEQRIQYKLKTKNLNLNPQQKEKIKIITRNYAQDLILYQEYYDKYNKTGRNKIKFLNDKYNKTLENAFLALNIVTKTSSNLQNFETKAKAIGVNTKNIQKVKEAYQLKEEALQKSKIKAQKVQQNSILIIQNAQQENKLIKIDYRKKIAESLTLEQYGTIFKTQLDLISKKLLEKKYNEVINTYNFSKQGAKEIYNLLKQQINTETLIKNYYNFDPKLVKQKLRVQQFKFEKKYVQKINELKK